MFGGLCDQHLVLADNTVVECGRVLLGTSSTPDCCGNVDGDGRRASPSPTFPSS
jgi:hypothetical protein